MSCLLLLLAAAALLPGPARAAFEWSGPAGTCAAAGSPARLARARGPAWALAHCRRPGLPELSAHGLHCSWGRGALGVGAGLGLLGPPRHRETDAGLALAWALPGERGAAAAAVHLLALEQSGARPRRRWVPAAAFACRGPRDWHLEIHGRRGAADLAAAQVRVAARRTAGPLEAAAALSRGGRHPWRLHLALRYRLEHGWRVALATRSAPRQFGLSLSWSRGQVRLGQALWSHPDLGPLWHLALAGGGLDLLLP